MQKQQELELNTREIMCNLSGGILAEKTDAYHVAKGHKNQVDIFKGFSEGQKRDIFNTQEQQRQDQLRKIQKEKDNEVDWAIRDTASQRAVELLEREKQRKAKNLAIQIRRENEAKAVQDKKR
jgi:murein tripeptide amidase MpaA